jgi:Holliday junction resolvase RusA-like endonuclease
MYMFFVAGEPKPQPRPRAFARRFGNAVRAGVYDSGGADGWKAAICAQANQHRPATPLSGPIVLSLRFLMPRPVGHFRIGKFADQLKGNAPVHHTAKPDADNLAKAVMDALTVGGWWLDDSQVVSLTIKKNWVSRGKAGCEVSIYAEEPH